MPTLTVVASIDSFLRTILKDSNQGAWTTAAIGPIYTGGGKVSLNRAIANFDVSALAGAVINSASMVRNVTLVTAGGFSARVKRCTRPSTWTELGVTWNKYDGSHYWSAEGGDFDDVTPTPAVYVEATAPGEEHTILSLADFVTDALANRSGIVSVMLIAQDETPGSSHTVEWKTKNHADTDQRWRMAIDYDPTPITTPPGRRGILPGKDERRPRAPATPSAGRRPLTPSRGRNP